MPSIGPYDYWAIEYAYKPLDPATEKEELAKIAARGSKEPWLAYATDEDGFGAGSPQGMDPTVNVFDLSSNPLAYYRKRLDLSRELWDRLQSRTLEEGETYDALRRSFLSGFTQLTRGLTPATKYIGGIVQVRDRAGSGRMPFTPVPAAQQREALKLLSEGAFSVDSFKFKPEFLASLPPNRLDYYDSLMHGNPGTASPVVSVPGAILGMQRTVLDQVMSDAVATRIVESQSLAAKPKESFQLSELYDSLQASIWSELRSGREITPMRRNLQREHLRRIAGTLLRPPGETPADARSLMRMNALALSAELKGAQAKPGYSKESRAHIAESLNTLDEPRRPPMQRGAACPPRAKAESPPVPPAGFSFLRNIRHSARQVLPSGVFPQYDRAITSVSRREAPHVPDASVAPALPRSLDLSPAARTGRPRSRSIRPRVYLSLLHPP